MEDKAMLAMPAPQESEDKAIRRLMAKKKPVQMEYVQKADDPTWFPKESQAKAFMKELEASTGIRHIIVFRDDGCAVEPLRLVAADDTSVEIGDILFDREEIEYEVTDITRVDVENWRVHLRNVENGAKRVFGMSEMKEQFRHSPWTKQEITGRSFSEFCQRVKNSAIGTWREISAVQVSVDFEKVLGVGIHIFATLFFMWMAYSVCIYPISLLSSQPEATAPEPVSIACTVQNLSSEKRDESYYNGSTIVVDEQTYYYIALTDENGKTVEFTCPKELWESVRIGDDVTVDYTVKESSALHQSIFGQDTTQIFTVNGYQLTGMKERIE